MEFAIVDANSFYASCHQVFRPDLRNKPVVVLSNNDGFVIARSKEAKALGIPDLEPFHKVEHILEKHRVAIFSSNFPLYGDISDRIMNTLKTFSPNVEVYSIDEMFLSLSGMHDDPMDYGRKIKMQVWQHTKMPVGVGIAPTKTLAKLANHAAKKIPKLDGVCTLDTDVRRLWLLRHTPVNKIWGVGGRYTKRLAEMKVYTAYELATTNPKTLRRRFNVCLERTIEELNGNACIALEEHPEDKKQIYSTRSFGRKVTSLEELQQAVAVYGCRAAEKMRMQGHMGLALHVFVNSSPFEPNYYLGQTKVKLPYPTDDSRIIVKAVKLAVAHIYKPGPRYLKAGVGITQMVSKSFYQDDLFCPGQSEQADTAMRVMDTINKYHGRNTVFLAGEGVQKKWALRQNYRSPEYTTNFSDLPIAT